MLLEKFACNMALYKGSHVSVGVSSNTNMPTLTDQLDSGITCLEIGIFSEVNEGEDWQVGYEISLKFILLVELRSHQLLLIPRP